MKNIPKELNQLIIDFSKTFEDYVDIGLDDFPNSFTSTNKKYTISITDECQTFCRVGHKQTFVQFNPKKLLESKGEVSAIGLNFFILWCTVKKSSYQIGSIVKTDIECDNIVLDYLIKSKKDLSELPKNMIYAFQSAINANNLKRMENLKKRIENKK